MSEKVQNHILVPFDFSEEAQIALSQTYNLARFTSTEVTLLFVMDAAPTSKLFSSQKEIIEDAETEKKAKQMLEAVATEATQLSGVKVNTLIKRGKVYEQVVQVAEDINAILIFMGTNGGSMLRRFMGSNTFRVVQEAHCPVVTIKGKEHRKGCRNIVLPLDTSKETKEKVTKAILIAKYFNSAIRVVSIINSSDDTTIGKMKKQLNQVHQYILESKVPCTAEAIEADDVVDGVLKYAEAVEGDLVLIMTQQELEWTDYFVGSYAQQIINNSDIPVMSIKPKERFGTGTATFSPFS